MDSYYFLNTVSRPGFSNKQIRLLSKIKLSIYKSAAYSYVMDIINHIEEKILG